MIWTIAFWKGAAERAIKTFFQTLATYLTLSVGADIIPAVGVDGVNWVAGLSFASVAAIYSLITSIGNAEFTAGKQ